MGFALAAAAQARGWDVDLISGPVQISCPEGVKCQKVVTGQEMYEAVSKCFPSCDILIMTAAIMDYRPKVVVDHKIKKFELQMVIEMEPVIDVLATVSQAKNHQVIVGFAAETDHLEEYAEKKLEAKKADFIVANLIGGRDGAFEKDENTVKVFTRQGQSLPMGPKSKRLLAEDLLNLFEPLLLDRRAQIFP